MKKEFFIALLIVFSIATIFFDYKAFNEAKLYEAKTLELVEKQNVKDLTKSNIRKITEKYSFGLYEDIEGVNTAQIKEEREAYKNESIKYTIFMMIPVLLILLSYFMVELKIFNIFASITSLISLTFGVITPIFMVTIHKEVQYIGDIILSFESKSMLASIHKLFESGDIVVALVIVLFSILIPALKTISLLMISIFEDNTFTHRFIEFFKMIGKWSMIDIFVVAVLLVFLTANKGDISKAEIGVGLYMFLAYVIISMFSNITINKMLKKVNK